MKKLLKIMILPVQLTFISACSEIIEYSPYDTDVNTKNLNEISSEIIATGISPHDTVKFALFSDIHDNYDDMSDAIKSINRQKGLQFVICCGDVTNSGLAQEYHWYLDVADGSDYPVITLIGNHDCLSNGYSVYTRLFGGSDFSFIAGRYKFILFDNIVWEKNNQEPDYRWLAGEVADVSYLNVFLSHFPPDSDEMEGVHDISCSNIIDSLNTILRIHGHTHCFRETVYDGIPIIISADIEDREYYIVTLTGEQSIVKRIRF